MTTIKTDIDSLLKILNEDPYPRATAKSALTTLSTIISSKNDEAITLVVSKGIIPIVCDILKDNRQIELLKERAPMMVIALDILKCILECGKRKNLEIPSLSGNQFKHEIKLNNGYKYMCQILDKDENENNFGLYMKARKLILQYFADDQIPKLSSQPSLSEFKAISEFHSISEFSMDSGFEHEFRVFSNGKVGENSIYHSVSQLFGEKADDLSSTTPMSFGAVNELFPAQIDGIAGASTNAKQNLGRNERNVYDSVSELFEEKAEDLSLCSPVSFGAVNELFPEQIDSEQKCAVFHLDIERNKYDSISGLFGEKAVDLSITPAMSFGAVNELFPVQTGNITVEQPYFAYENDTYAVIRLINEILLKFEL